MMRLLPHSSRAAVRRTRIACATVLALAAASCDQLGNFTQAFNGDCDTYQTRYQTELTAGGQLAAQIPATPDGFAMGLVLNQRAVNDFFQRLGDTSLPVLSQNLGNIPLLGAITIAVQPSIPTLGIGGNARCIDCFRASIPFAIGVGVGDTSPNLGGGTLSAQLPLGMIPRDNQTTALVASFQQMEVTGLDLDITRNTAVNAVLDQIEPVTTTLLTSFLQSRFEDAPVATFDSWAIGQGNVLLAGRGPFVFPEQETILIAMQSNLIVGDSSSLGQQAALPPGADFGVVFHPNLLLAMTRRMHFEDVIPQGYSESGQLATGLASTTVTFQSMQTDDSGLLRTGATLYQSQNLCGTANLAASFGLQLEPGSFAFSVQDVSITDGEGVGSLFSQDAWLTGPLVDKLLSTLEVTVNYDQIFGGEAAEQTQMAPFQANIDGRGVSVYFNL
jgi:hypothetical protein